MNMNGNQGLDALAALCNGARKVAEGSNSSIISQLPTPPTKTTCGITSPRSIISPGVTPMTYGTMAQNADVRSMDPNISTNNLSMNNIQQWQQQHPMNQAAILPPPSPPVQTQNNQNLTMVNPLQTTQQASADNSLQQLAYFHFIQSQAAAAAQLAQHQVSVQGQGQRSSVMSCPTDPNAAAIAIMLAAQKQQHNLQQDTTSFIPQHQRKQTQVEPLPQQQTKPQPQLQPQQTVHHVRQNYEQGTKCDVGKSQQSQYQQIIPSGPLVSRNVANSAESGMQPPSPHEPSMSSSSSPQLTKALSIPVPIAAAKSSDDSIIRSKVLPQTASSQKQVFQQPILMRKPFPKSISGKGEKRKTSDDQIKPDATENDGLPPSNGNKKQMKRAANRRSAQLSRKRKKQFIEELKEENDELRRKELILLSIPDLIVVFDSGGKLWFVSHSVRRFLKFSPAELEGSSFWDRLCDESVRLLKAAFMDALAAREKDCETAPLGSGVWELRLRDKDGSQKLVALNGVVHFTGDSPECVCSIRPKEDLSSKTRTEEKAPQTKIHYTDPNNKINLVVKPQQSVIYHASNDGIIKGVPLSGSLDNAAARVSDAESGSSVGSEGSSSDI